MLNIKGIHPDDALSIAVRAIYYGYSKEAFVAYVEDFKLRQIGAPVGPYPGFPPDYTPSLEDRENPNYHLDIASRRICDEPFPNSGDPEALREAAKWIIDDPVLEEYLECLRWD